MKQSIVLLDNGSVRPASILAARELARRVSSKIGKPVSHAACQHSDKVPAAELAGEPCLVWGDFLEREWARGIQRILVLPLFFGPSSAIAIKARRVARQFCERRPGVSCEVARSLVDVSDETDDGIAQLISQQVIEKLDTVSEKRTQCILVDHGSPNPEVGRCRDLVGKQLAESLADRGVNVIASSMERRPGPDYDFNEPLLESVLEELDSSKIERIVLAYLFLFPGRHAGPGGDIDTICQQSRFSQDGGEIVKCSLVGELSGLEGILTERYSQLTQKGNGLFSVAPVEQPR